MSVIADTLKFKKACTYALKHFLGVSEEEIILIISDDTLGEIGKTFYESAKKITEQAYYIELKTFKVNGEEVPEMVAESMKLADAVLCVTAKSFTYTRAVREAAKLGVRIGTMPGITEDFVLRCINSENSKIIERNKRLMDSLEGVSEIKIETKAGTNVTVNVQGCPLFNSNGDISMISKFGNIPSGEISIAPNETKSTGKIVIDGSASMMGIIKDPVSMDIEHGVATKISGAGGDARIFARFMKKVDDLRTHTLSKIGIGTNHNAVLSGNIMEEIKSMGSVSIGFGNNINIGGRIDIPSHHNATLRKATLFADGKKIVADGVLLID